MAYGRYSFHQLQNSFLTDEGLHSAGITLLLIVLCEAPDITLAVHVYTIDQPLPHGSAKDRKSTATEQY